MGPTAEMGAAIDSGGRLQVQHLHSSAPGEVRSLLLCVVLEPLHDTRNHAARYQSMAARVCVGACVARRRPRRAPCRRRARGTRRTSPASTSRQNTRARRPKTPGVLVKFQQFHFSSFLKPCLSVRPGGRLSHRGGTAIAPLPPKKHCCSRSRLRSAQQCVPLASSAAPRACADPWKDRG